MQETSTKLSNGRYSQSKFARFMFNRNARHRDRVLRLIVFPADASKFHFSRGYHPLPVTVLFLGYALPSYRTLLPISLSLCFSFSRIFQREKATTAAGLFLLLTPLIYEASMSALFFHKRFNDRSKCASFSSLKHFHGTRLDFIQRRTVPHLNTL